MKNKFLTGALVAGTMAIGFLGQVDPAEALTFGTSQTFGFQNITNNNSTDTGTFGQYFVDVWEITNSPNQVLFNIRNEGPAKSTISEVYFDDGSLLGISGLIDSNDNALPGAGSLLGLDYSKVNFTAGSGSPPNLPGGNDFDFNTTAGFLADAVNPAPQNGVNTKEVLGILFNLKENQTYSDIITAIQMAQFDKDIEGALRIGIHVTNFASGGSESFVNTTPIPTPALLPGAIGMGIAAFRKKKREQGLEEATQEA